MQYSVNGRKKIEVKHSKLLPIWQ